MTDFNQLKSRNDLSKFLGVPLYKLTHILYVKKVDNLYYTFEIPKKSGGKRVINAPEDDLKSIQKTLANKLLSYNNKTHPEKFSKHNVSHGFERNKSIITNAESHKNKKVIINVDIDNFFGSFHFGRVKGFFQKNKYFQLPESVAIIIAQLTCYKGSLPQGAPTSPVITNLICNILDIRLLNLTKKYKLYYTRYADDLTFSTNDKNMKQHVSSFLLELNIIINNFGLKLNESKTRISYQNTRQEVTGLTVNSKLNTNKNFIKETRAMLNHLYKYGDFFIDGEPGTLNQLEGRFSFINHLDWYQNMSIHKNGKKKIDFYHLNGREKQYQKFLFYKYFIANDAPLIITEGKTDISYIKAALKKLHREYPRLVNQNNDGRFKFNIKFLKRSKRLKYFLNLVKNGADTMKNIYKFYSDKENEKYPNYLKELDNNKVFPINPVILIFDNEVMSDRPLKNFLNFINMDNNKKEMLYSDNLINIKSNLYIISNPLVKDMEECEIEDLFDDEVLSTKIDGKTFNRNKNLNTKTEYSKTKFANHIVQNYESINFNNFKPMLENIDNIIQKY